MSYDLDLNDPITGECLKLDVPHHMRGGTYAVGGSSYASLNITYNYAKHFYNTIDEEEGLRFLYGKTGAEVIPILEAAIAKLGDDVSEDYWEATEGNAKQALMQLLALSKMRPDGVWSGD